MVIEYYFNCICDTLKFFDSEIIKKPFKELIFNTTEFTRGNAFRFRASQNPKVVIGSNRKYSISKESAAKIRLADIIAASSCFPSAFEPIIFPDDFVGFNEKLDEPFPCALMDGGVYDNQGIASILLADKLKKKEDSDEETQTRATEENFDLRQEKIETEEFIDFFIISDTNQRSDEILEPHNTSDISIKIRENIVLPLLVIQQYALQKIGEGNAHKALYEKIVTRSLYGNINASRNSA